MRVVIALDERPDDTPLGRVGQLLDLRGAEIVLAHALDTGPREEWEQGALRRLLRPGPPRADGERMRTVDLDAGERLLAAAASATGAWPSASVRTRLLEGSPKHALRALLDAEGADVLVVFVHGRAVGPASIHKEARFLIDHAPCAVLVVKG